MAKPQYPSEKKDQYMLRLPDGMRDTLKAEAEKNGRSMNTEIVARISRTLIEDDYLPKYIERHEELERDRYATVRHLNKIETLTEALLKEVHALRDGPEPIDTDEK